MKKAIVFGISGQDGYYIRELLLKNNIEVIGVSRSVGDWITGDINNLNFVTDLIKSNKPQYVFDLAANSTTKHEALFENHETISTGTLNLLESVYKYSQDSKVFLSGSGLQFKNKGVPISEGDKFEASSAYSVSRIHSVYAARYYRSLGIKVYIGYLFNHDSPLRSERHVSQKVVSAVGRISKGSKETLELGKIMVRKEYTFAGDVVLAIFKLVENESIFESVIGSGVSYTLVDWLTICFGYFNLDWKNYVVINHSYKNEYDIFVSDPRTIFSLGWKPHVDIFKLAEMMITNK